MSKARRKARTSAQEVKFIYTCAICVLSGVGLGLFIGVGVVHTAFGC